VRSQASWLAEGRGAPLEQAITTAAKEAGSRGRRRIESAGANGSAPDYMPASSSRAAGMSMAFLSFAAATKTTRVYLVPFSGVCCGGEELRP
jgi:hypothetical protein